MEIPRWWWCWWVLLVICGSAIEISLQLWEGCPGKPGHFHCAKHTGNQNEFLSCSVFLVFLVFILKPTFPELCPFTGGCFFVKAGILAKYSLNRSSFLLTYSAFLHHTDSFLYYCSGCTVHIKAWQVWDEGFFHYYPREKQQGPAW